MKGKSILILTAAGIMLAACQSNTYHIKGTVKDVQEDTLFLTTDLHQGTPRDTILVKDGQFELSGETDSTYFCMIYSKNEEALNIPSSSSLERRRCSCPRLLGKDASAALPSMTSSSV